MTESIKQYSPWIAAAAGGVISGFCAKKLFKFSTMKSLAIGMSIPVAVAIGSVAFSGSGSKLNLLQRLIGNEAREKGWRLTAQGKEYVIISEGNDRSRVVRACWKNDSDLYLEGFVKDPQTGAETPKGMPALLSEQYLNQEGPTRIVTEIEEIFDGLPTS